MIGAVQLIGTGGRFRWVVSHLKTVLGQVQRNAYFTPGCRFRNPANNPENNPTKNRTIGAA
jgi:hypothetical protein